MRPSERTFLGYRFGHAHKFSFNRKARLTTSRSHGKSALARRADLKHFA
jgi:hypothetical protein